MRLRLVSGPKPPKGVKPVMVKCEGHTKTSWWFEEVESDNKSGGETHER